MTYLIFDLETQTHASQKRKANPFNPDNYIVARGWKKQDDARCSWQYFKERSTETLKIDKDVTLLVGLNIKFDLHYEMQYGNEDLKDFFKRGGRVWCCQYAEYILEGMDRNSHMVSMDSIIEKYGGRKKIDEVKLLWEAGVQTSDINEDLLIDYLVGTESQGRNGGDIGNTEKIFLGQLKRAKEQNQLTGIMHRMDGLCATTEMEFNGVQIDMDVAKERLVKLSRELSQVEADLNQYVIDVPDEVNFNWSSPIHSSAILFGGTIKYQKQTPWIDPDTGEFARKKEIVKWPLVNGEAVETVPEGSEQDTYVSGKKRGNLKFRNVNVLGEVKRKYQDFTYQLPGFTTPRDNWKTKRTDGAGNPVYSTNADTITSLAFSSVPFLKVYTRRQFLQKEIGTYYLAVNNNKATGMLTCVNPQTHRINHKLNHTSTVTGRLSSSDPNLQNCSRKDKSEVKKMFVTRFGKDGHKVEADYSQLEVVVQAVLTGDPKLNADLNNGVDFHCVRVAAWKDIPYEEALARCKDEDHPMYDEWSAIRTKAKHFSFQRAYGAGAQAISDSTGMKIDDVKALIEAEERLYPMVVSFNSDVEKQVHSSAEPFKKFWPGGGYKIYRKGKYISPTETYYIFRSHDAPGWLKKRGVEDSFMPTEMKNYPVQGTAGEMVITILGKLWRNFIEKENYNGKAFLVNTVHDCIWVDTHNDVIHEVAADVKRIMESIPDIFRSAYDMQIDVPFPVDIEVGLDMYDMHAYNSDTNYIQGLTT